MSRYLSIVFIAFTGTALAFDLVAAVANPGRLWSWVLVALMGLCLIVQVRVARDARGRRLARAVDHFDEPIPPQNVQLRQPDGTNVPVELVYAGWIDGAHQWIAVTPIRAMPGAGLTADMIPAHTALVLGFTAPD